MRASESPCPLTEADIAEPVVLAGAKPEAVLSDLYPAPADQISFAIGADDDLHVVWRRPDKGEIWYARIEVSGKDVLIIRIPQRVGTPQTVHLRDQSGFLRKDRERRALAISPFTVAAFTLSTIREMKTGDLSASPDTMKAGFTLTLKRSGIATIRLSTSIGMVSSMLLLDPGRTIQTRIGALIPMGF